MPVINFDYHDLCSMLGEEVPRKTLLERIPMIGADMHDTEGEVDEMSVEFFPDRPDLYSVEGLARGMRAFLDIEPGMTEYDVDDSDIDVLRMSGHTSAVRSSSEWRSMTHSSDRSWRCRRNCISRSGGRGRRSP